MTAYTPQFSVSRNLEMREVYYSLWGLFTLSAVEQLFAELMRVSKPFIEDRQGFRVLGDLRKFSVQPREIGEKIHLSQTTSAKLGVDKMAILPSSVLQMQQIRRVSEALEVEFFDDKAEALAWLRTA